MIPQRISVVGTSGTGKTSLARRIAAGLGVPHLELDGVFHQPDWVPLAGEVFRERVGRFIAGESWIVDGNYSVVRDLVWGRAEVVVWLDLPRPVVMRRIVARSAGRVLLRRRLWNGNRERVGNLLSRDPRQNIVLWAWTTHDQNRQKYETAMADPAWDHLQFVRLRSTADVEGWVAALA